jgi:tetratricopeptide (TPR) repeat protein
MANEWYRKASWTKEDQDDFSTRLQRCRSDANRAQYLRIQASHLQLLAAPEMYQSALVLLERILTDFPSRFELAMTHFQKAECFEGLGDPRRALESYRRALQAEREFKNMKTNAWLEFGWLVVRHGFTDAYTETLAIMDEFKGQLMFPVERFRYFGILAIISAHNSDVAVARDFAAKALAATLTKDSGFRYHPTVGLVKNPDEKIIGRLQKIAAAR